MSTRAPEFRPARPATGRPRCADCQRVFAAGHVPAPTVGGPRHGRLICRDCRAVHEEAAQMSAQRSLTLDL